MALNTNYLSTDRGIVKVLQILLGLVVCSVLCANWYGGSSCFGEGRLGYTSGLNFVALIINVVLFLLNIFEITFVKLEHFYNMVLTVLFIVATVLYLWYIIQFGAWGLWMIITAAILVIFVLLYSFDMSASKRHQQDHIPI